jgi:phosphate transport system permease protein
MRVTMGRLPVTSGWRDMRRGGPARRSETRRGTVVAVVSRPEPSVPPAGDDVPRRIVVEVAPADRVFRGVLRACGIAVLVITAGVLLFLALRSVSALHVMGLRFFTTSTWFISTNQFGIAAILPFTVLIATIALVLAIPVGIATALYISEYAPRRLQRPLIAMVDLMAAIPSIIVALFMLYFLMPRMLGFDSWLGHHLSFIPLFNTHGAPSFASSYVGAPFIGGVGVSLMVIPIVTSLTRQVFSQAPAGEREAAYALGSTRWGMIRTVVLPYGRAGIIGASMLGLGRALGETIVVAFLLTPVFHFSWHILESGGNSVTLMIANLLLDSGPMGVSALMAAGLVLFVMTLGINTLAAIVISRSRSGATASAD